jgi:NADPH:quinone reductase-like Zn-dependent oxidoreductase
MREDGRLVGAALPQSPDGRAGEDVELLGAVATAARLVLRSMSGRYRFIYGLTGDPPSKQGFASLVEWLAQGKLAPRLAAAYSLDRLADAHRASETGRAVGKISVVIP